MEEAVGSLQFDLLVNKISHPYITALIVMVTCKQKTSVSYMQDIWWTEKLQKNISYEVLVLLCMYYCFVLRTSSGTN